MVEDSSDTDIVMDFDSGIDSIEFLIESFGYDELDTLRDPEGVAEAGKDNRLRLVDVNADNVQFRMSTEPREQAPSE